MKYKKIIFPVLALVMGLIITKSVFAETFPTITFTCESQTGQLLAANDGFSILRTCPTGSRHVTIVGLQGPKGDKGDQGIPGPQGSTGINGQDGAVGPQGLQGNPGPQGLAGITGAGNIAFIFYDGNTWALTTDGKTWIKNTGDWSNNPLAVPKDVPIPTSSIVQWSVWSFLDSRGNVWIGNTGTWVNSGHP